MEDFNQQLEQAIKKMTMQTLKIKNRYLRELGNWLVTLELAGNECRQRTRFIDLIIPRIKEIDDEFKKIDQRIKDCAKKDKKGELVKLNERQKLDRDGKPMMGKDGKPVMEWDLDVPQEEIEKVNVELIKYLDEEFVIDVLDSNKEKVRITKEIILNTDKKFTGADAVIYNAWCEAFETLVFEK